jgi:polyisoprenoid-binding protein YceI
VRQALFERLFGGWCWAALWVLFLAPQVQADSWRSLEQGSVLQFQAGYEGEPLEGEFRAFTTELKLDAPSSPGNSMRVVVKTGSISFGSDDLREGAMTQEWFYVDRFPEAVFDSEDIKVTGAGSYVATGVLHLKSESKPVAVPFTLDTSQDVGVLSGEVRLKRTDFGIGTGEWSNGDTIGLDVVVSFHVALQRLD